MAGRNNTRELGSVIAGMLAGLPHSGARKILECDAMQTLFECLPEHLKGKCAPAEIHYIKSGDGAPRAVCEIWVDDRLTWDILTRERIRLVREVAEKTGRTVIEDVSHRLVSSRMLKRQIAVVSIGAD